MKRVVLFVFLALITATSWGYDLTIDGVMYNLDNEQGTAEVAKYDNASTGSTSLEIPSTVVSDGVEYRVSSIAKMAFYRSTLTSVTLPESLETIGENAFQYCTGIKTIVIPNSVKSIGSFAFATSGIESLTIGSSVESIGERAFAFCSNLRAIIIPESVKSIGDYLLGNDDNLTLITVENGNTVYDSREKCNAIIETATNTLVEGCAKTVIPNTVTRIGYMAFSSRARLTSITIPESVTTIDDYAFSATALSSVTIPNSVTTIGNNAFDGCELLRSVTLGKSLTSIGESAFYQCYDLRSVSLPESVTNIGAYAFSNCKSITSVRIPDGVTSIQDRTFYSCSQLATVTLPATLTSIGESAFASTSLSSISLPTSLTTIGKGAFSRTKLTSVVIPDGITAISDNCFLNCEALKTVTIPNSVTKIGAWAFQNCAVLRAITIPGNVVEVGMDALSACSRLADITCLAMTPPTTMNYSGDYRINLHVLPGCKKAYQDVRYWRDFNILEDAVSGIGAVKMSTADAADKISTVSGLRISAPQKGINIINGKKVMR